MCIDGAYCGDVSRELFWPAGAVGVASGALAVAVQAWLRSVAVSRGVQPAGASAHACGAFGTGTFWARVEVFGDVMLRALACAASTLGMATACAAYIETGVQSWWTFLDLYWAAPSAGGPISAPAAPW